MQKNGLLKKGKLTKKYAKYFRLHMINMLTKISPNKN